MKKRRFISCLCIVALAVAAGSSEWACIAQSDVNGDHQVDVLDLQAIVAGVLDGPSEGAADVNGDGSINVLDFQLAFSQTRQASEPARLPSRKPAEKTCHLSYQVVELPRQILSHEYLIAPITAGPENRIFERPERCIPAPGKERYLQQLTPNAPPFLA